MADEQQGCFDGWAIVELLGHRRLAGNVRQVTMGTAALLRVDVPEISLPAGEWVSGQGYAAEAVQVPGFSTFVNPASLYCLTPCTEEHAREQAAADRQLPPGFLAPPTSLRALPAGSSPDDDVPF